MLICAPGRIPRQHILGERVLDPVLDRSLERPGAVNGVESRVGDETQHGRRHANLQFVVGKSPIEQVDLQPRYSENLVLAERMKDDDFIDAIDEFRRKVTDCGV